MKRGEIWTLKDENYASKARPVIIIQSDNNSFESVILCLFTTFDSSNINTRVFIKATPENGLIKDSYVMTEKIVTVKKSIVRTHIGELTKQEMDEISEKLRIVLGL